MATTVMSLKTDKKLKESAQKIAKDMGFSLGTLLNAFLHQLVKEKKVNFSAYPELPAERITPKLERTLAKIEKDIKAGRNLSPKFNSMKEAIQYLHHHER